MIIRCGNLMKSHIVHDTGHLLYQQSYEQQFFELIESCFTTRIHISQRRILQFVFVNKNKRSIPFQWVTNISSKLYMCILKLPKV